MSKALELQHAQLSRRGVALMGGARGASLQVDAGFRVYLGILGNHVFFGYGNS